MKNVCIGCFTKSDMYTFCMYNRLWHHYKKKENLFLKLNNSKSAKIFNFEKITKYTPVVYLKGSGRYGHLWEVHGVQTGGPWVPNKEAILNEILCYPYEKKLGYYKYD